MILGEQKTGIDWDNECTFEPPRAKPMPDFERAHEHFQTMLDKKRSHKKPTQVAPFNFEAAKKIPDINYLENDNELLRKAKELQLMREKNERNFQKIKEQSVEGFIPSSTMKFKDQVEKTKQERELRHKKELKQIKEEETRAKNYEKNAKKLRETLNAQEEQRKAEKEKKEGSKSKNQKQEEFNASTRQHKLKLKEFEAKLADRPPVFQRCTLM